MKNCLEIVEEADIKYMFTKIIILIMKRNEQEKHKIKSVLHQSARIRGNLFNFFNMNIKIA